MNDAVLYQPAAPDSYVGILTLNRPEERNAMSVEILEAFAEKVAVAKADPNLRALVVTGSGSCFSAGANLRGDIQRELPGPVRLPHEGSFGMYTGFLSLLEIEVPVVGALNGHAVGGGFGLSLLCDLRVGALQSKYGANFTKIGLHPGLAIAYLLPRLIGLPRASEFLYTGRLMRGEEAAALGLFNRAVPQDEVLPQAMALAEEIAAAAPAAVRLTKETIRQHLGWEIRQAAYREAYAQAATVATSDFQEGVQAFLEKRAPDFKGT